MQHEAHRPAPTPHRASRRGQRCGARHSKCQTTSKTGPRATSKTGPPSLQRSVVSGLPGGAVGQAARQGNGTTDAHRCSPMVRVRHGHSRRPSKDQSWRAAPERWPLSHRCASVVPNSCFAASLSTLPVRTRTLAARWQESHAPIRAAVPYARACSVAAEPHAPEAVARPAPRTVSPQSAHETMARLARDRSVRYSD
jgi:hypothetical protein